MADFDCRCLELGPRLGSYDETCIGVDKTNGRHGDVTVRTCRECSRVWLHYLVEYEAFSKSGRWFSGLLRDETVNSVTPETAVSILEELPWHVYGGSYFNTSGRRGTGLVKADL